MQKIKMGDEVEVIAGKDKGKRGKIATILKDDRVLVSGVNMVKKHLKANPQKGIPGGITPKEAPLHRSNIALVNPSSGKADRVGIRFTEDGKKVRFFKSDNEQVEK